MVRPTRCLALILLWCVCGAGCRFGHLKSDLERMEQFGTLRGQVDVLDWAGAPVVALALRVPDQMRGAIEVVAQQNLAAPGRFTFDLAPGEYLPGAFEDTNRNQRYDSGERARFGDEPVVVAAGGAALEVTVEVSTVLHGVLATRLRGTVDERLFVVGQQAKLDDRRFGMKEARVGIWRPLRAMERYPAGLFPLQTPDPERTPVLFVHGMGGYSQEFSTLIRALDKGQFEPWVFQFPSGLPITTSSELLRRAVTQMQAVRGGRRACLVAHSMGGVIARHALAHANFAEAFSLLVTVASPMAGVQSAEVGVRYAPAVVPAWRELVPDSAVIRSLHKTPLPEHLRYELLFAYTADSGQDSVVPLASQLIAAAQAEAHNVRGFSGSHSQVLKLPRLIKHVKAALSRVAQAGTSSSADPAPL